MERAEGLIYDVDVPVVLDPPLQSTLWDHAYPAPLLVAALVSPGSSVVELGGEDGLFAILAAVLGAQAAVVCDDPARALRNAELNAARLSATTGSREPALVIAHVGQNAYTDSGLVVCLTPDVAPNGRVRVTVAEGKVSVDADGPIPDAPHALVPPDHLMHVVQAVEDALGAFEQRHPHPWHARALASAVRLIERQRDQADAQSALARRDVDRAHQQMAEAREQLRAVRKSRSWRYTGLLRRVLR